MWQSNKPLSNRWVLIIKLHVIVLISLLIGLIVTSFNGRKLGTVLSCLLPVTLFFSLLIWQIEAFSVSGYDTSALAVAFLMLGALSLFAGLLGNIVGRKLFHKPKEPES